jgi:hypothetical protein
MARRDAFTGLRDPNPITEVEEDQQQVSTMIPRQPLDLIPTADLRKKRSRKWEQEHRLETVTYRGIPQQVVDLIIKDAQSLSVPRDEVVRAFLEYGARLYRNGEIKLLAYPKAQRMTLYAEGNEGNTNFPAQTSENHKWLAEAFPVPEKKAGGTKRKIQERPRSYPSMGNKSDIPNSTFIKGRSSVDCAGAYFTGRRSCLFLRNRRFTGFSQWKFNSATVS